MSAMSLNPKVGVVEGDNRNQRGVCRGDFVVVMDPSTPSREGRDSVVAMDPSSPSHEDITRGQLGHDSPPPGLCHGRSVADPMRVEYSMGSNRQPPYNDSKIEWTDLRRVVESNTKPVVIDTGRVDSRFLDAPVEFNGQERVVDARFCHEGYVSRPQEVGRPHEVIHRMAAEGSRRSCLVASEDTRGDNDCRADLRGPALGHSDFQFGSEEFRMTTSDAKPSSDLMTNRGPDRNGHVDLAGAHRSELASNLADSRSDIRTGSPLRQQQHQMIDSRSKSNRQQSQQQQQQSSSSSSSSHGKEIAVLESMLANDQSAIYAMEDQAYNPAKLFVGGLGQQSTEASLSSYFSRFGVVKDSVVIADRHSGRSRGFGFVVFENHDVVDQCLTCRHDIDGVSVSSSSLELINLLRSVKFVAQSLAMRLEERYPMIPLNSQAKSMLGVYQKPSQKRKFATTSATDLDPYETSRSCTTR